MCALDEVKFVGTEYAHVRCDCGWFKTVRYPVRQSGRKAIGIQRVLKGKVMSKKAWLKQVSFDRYVLHVLASR